MLFGGNRKVTHGQNKNLFIYVLFSTERNRIKKYKSKMITSTHSSHKDIENEKIA